MKTICKCTFCILSVLFLMIFSGCGTAEYSVKDFADITVVGYTEHGSLSIKVSDAAVNRIYADGKKDKTAALRFAETFRFSYEGQNEDDSFFTNGDIVTINVTYDESMAKDLGIAFTDSSFDYTIEGLEDKLETSPFEGLSVKFSGVAPYGTVQLDKSNCIQYVIDNVTFICDNHDLSNGDKVIVKAEFNKEIAERNGYVFTEDVKKFTVVGLSKYVTTMMGVDYTPVTARMRYMAEQFVGGTETAYKSLNWYFGDEDSDSDSDGFIDDDENTNEFEEQPSDDGEDVSSDEDSEDDGEKSGNESGGASSKVKRKTNVQKIKDDFSLSDFKAKFEYTPVECLYALNPLQYSDNAFYSVYKVKGTFVCESTSGSGYINAGDTVVGELYVTVSLTGASVDIKNNLFYENSVLQNSHSYSPRSYPEYSDMSSDVYKTSTYVVEKLDYLEDQDAYDKFTDEMKNYNTKSGPEVSHIHIESDTDSEKKKKRSSSAEEDESGAVETDTDTDTDTEFYDESYADYEQDQNDENDDGFYFEYDYDEEEEY